MRYLICAIIANAFTARFFFLFHYDLWNADEQIDILSYIYERMYTQMCAR